MTVMRAEVTAKVSGKMKIIKVKRKRVLIEGPEGDRHWVRVGDEVTMTLTYRAGTP